MTIDDLRALHPQLRLALYAYEPGGDVTFEVIGPDDEVFSFTGATAQDAIERAFPPEPAAPEPAPNVFD